MTVSELIKSLEEIKARRGDVKVLTATGRCTGSITNINDGEAHIFLDAEDLHYEKEMNNINKDDNIVVIY